MFFTASATTDVGTDTTSARQLTPYPTHMNEHITDTKLNMVSLTETPISSSTPNSRFVDITQQTELTTAAQNSMGVSATRSVPVEATTVALTTASRTTFTAATDTSSWTVRTTDERSLDGEVVLRVCSAYPCSDTVERQLAWSSSLVLEADVLNTTLASVATYYQFEILSDGASTWSSATASRFGSVIPQAAGLLVGTPYDVSVAIGFDGIGQGKALVKNVTFTAPPLLTSIELVETEGDASVRFFNVSVNAAVAHPDAAPLTFVYRMIGDGLNVLILSDAGDTVGFSAPTTRDFVVEVTIVDMFGSSVVCGADVACPSVEKLDIETAQVVTDVLDQVRNGTDGKAAFLSGIDAVVVDNGTATENLEVLVGAFEGSVVSAEEQTTSSLSMDLSVLNALVQAALAEYLAGLDLVSTVVAVADSMTENNIDNTIAEQFVEVVDTLVGPDSVGGQEAAVEFGDYLENVCGAIEDGEVPDGEVTSLNTTSFDLSCSSAESGVLVDVGSDGAALIFEDSDGGDVATVTMATWRTDVNQSAVAGNETSVSISNVVTVHITGSNDSRTVEAEDIEDSVVTLVLELGSTGDSETVRKSASCRYLEEARMVWLDRGMFLRGLSVNYEALTSSAMCISTHLTTMGMVDNSQFSQIVEDTVSTVTKRIALVNNVDTFNADKEPNWFVIGIFSGVAAVFVLIIFVAKATGRKKAVLVGREVFIQQGALSRPSVVGAAGSEAILRGWLSAKEVVLMVFLHIIYIGQSIYRAVLSLESCGHCVFSC